MANAMVIQIEDVEMSNPPNLTWKMAVIFTGVDVPGGFGGAEVLFNTNSSPTAPQIAAAAVAAIQAQATTMGFTVAAGRSLLPSYAAQ